MRCLRERTAGIVKRNDETEIGGPREIKLCAKAVTKVFPSRRRGGEPVVALHEFSINLFSGEFVSFLGPSGCGKSTFLRIVAGLEKPTSGQVLVDGKEVDRPDPERGVLFQSYALFPWMTVKQNIELGPMFRGISRVERHRISEMYLELTGLSPFAHHFPHELSGGMQQRCALARLLANNPKVLLMDEPLAALDAFTRLNLQEELLRIWGQEKQPKERKTVVYITHSVEEAVFLSDRIVVMTPRPGRLREVVEVSLPRPRTHELRASSGYVEMVGRLWGKMEF